MKFTIFGIKIYVSFFFFFFVTLFLIFDKTGYASITLFAVLIHEAGHLFMMFVTGYMPDSINLIPGSVQIVTYLTPETKTQILISLSGPLMNLSAFSAIYLLNRAVSSYALEFGTINLAIFLINIIPAKGFDGGDVLFGIVAQKQGVKRAQTVLKAATIIMAFAFISAFTALMFNGILNLSVIIVALYLFAAVYLKTG